MTDRLPSPLHPRVPLRRGKSLRQVLKEHGLLERYLKQHPDNLASKYYQAGVSAEPLQNYMDVRMAGQRGWHQRDAPQGCWPLTRPPSSLPDPLAPYLSC